MFELEVSLEEAKDLAKSFLRAEKQTMMQLQRLPLLLVVLIAVIGCGESKQSEPAEGESPTQTIVLTHAGDQEIAAIKAVREVTGLGLSDAKGIVDSLPSVIISGVPVDEADAIAVKLRKAGMTIEVRDDGKGPP